MTLKFKTAKAQWMSRIPFELVFWITAMLLLAAAQPVYPHQGNHFSLCPLAAAGLEWCPGCGLGRSITLFLHGEWRDGFRQHWLGVPAIVIISGRVYVLAKAEWKKLIVKGGENV
ncbi:DUF2752 domain-containing protein [Pedobacter antarcticus]|uniref:DUF2752 domain-containing protein n=1 Tax=Pedobacter antarcticus TaxID=34086 RepID=UPI002931814B|nr:DUF2752 domain-containing protein [Pedobacter antarcticus]